MRSAMVPLLQGDTVGLAAVALFASSGVIGGLGPDFDARALSYGLPTGISRVHYAQLIWASLVEDVIFGDVPGIRSCWAR